MGEKKSSRPAMVEGKVKMIPSQVEPAKKMARVACLHEVRIRESGQNSTTPGYIRKENEKSNRPKKRRRGKGLKVPPSLSPVKSQRDTSPVEVMGALKVICV